MSRDIFFQEREVTITHRGKVSRWVLFLQYLLLALVFVILVPAGFLIASKDALPNDSLYSYKRQIENFALTSFSESPWEIPIHNMILGRRFNEAILMLQKGDESGFEEFVGQARTTGEKIVALSEKEKRISHALDLINRLKGYKRTISDLVKRQEDLLVVNRINEEIGKIILRLEEQGIKKK